MLIELLVLQQVDPGTGYQRTSALLHEISELLTVKDIFLLYILKSNIK